MLYLSMYGRCSRPNDTFYGSVWYSPTRIIVRSCNFSVAFILISALVLLISTMCHNTFCISCSSSFLSEIVLTRSDLSLVLTILTWHFCQFQIEAIEHNQMIIQTLVF